MRPSRTNPTWAPSWIPPPPFLLPEGERGKERERERGGEGKRGAAPSHSPIRPPSLWGARHPFVGWCASLLWPIWPISSPEGFRYPPDTLVCTRYIPKHLRCPNTIIEYINLYLSTISKLLVMSVISSGTPNNIQSPNHITHKIQIVIEP